MKDPSTANHWILAVESLERPLRVTPDGWWLASDGLFGLIRQSIERHLELQARLF
jgi:hypothetical protein